MSTSSLGGVPLSSSIFLTMSRPAVTLPKTTWRPSSQLVLTVQMKNWLPLVSGPALRTGGAGRDWNGEAGERWRKAGRGSMENRVVVVWHRSRVVSGRSTVNAQAGAGMKPPPDASNIC